MATLLVAKPGQFVELAKFIDSVDYINHAIPTSGELDGALFRLVSLGWLEQVDMTFSPTNRSEEFYEPKRASRSSLLDDIDYVAEKIGSPVWTIAQVMPKTPEKFGTPGLSESVVEDAYRRYKNWTNSRSIAA